MFWRRPSNQTPPVLQKFIAARCVQCSYIKFPCPSLPLASLTEQSPRAFGHINTQAYGKTKVQPEEELSEVRLPMLKWMRLRVPWRQKLEA